MNIPDGLNENLFCVYNPDLDMFLTTTSYLNGDGLTIDRNEYGWKRYGNGKLCVAMKPERFDEMVETNEDFWNFLTVNDLWGKLVLLPWDIKTRTIDYVNGMKM